MGCQTEIASTIIKGGGNYLLSTKANQPTLQADIVRTFAEANDSRRRSADELAQPRVETFEEVDKGHGRLEKRQ
jgi:predicted transposase YbfD/YdcC